MRLAFLALVLMFTSAPTVYAESDNLTVMSRNLYLGADVGVALEKIPNFPAAAQFMWNQVRATDFTRRAPLLARQIIDSHADVIGIQEATHWYCQKNLWSRKVVVYDFLKEFLAATREEGSEYVLASYKGKEALNIGYSIPAIPYLTLVRDPETFQPLFGSDSAACGFEIGDAIVVKREIAPHVLNVGNSEYEASYSIVPKIMTIYRGYTWIDLDFAGRRTRIVSTHLESLWDKGKVPNAALQATQLIDDLKKTTMPLVVIGDFNSDPRDPRSNSKSNPGGQPESSDTCKAQVASPTIKTAIDVCSAYWLMRHAGFIDSGPNPLSASNYTWGMNALLTGADPTRLKSALEMGNQEGFTDRLDYIFLKNGIQLISSKVIGNNVAKGAKWPTDHAGIVATIHLPESRALSDSLDPHDPFPISFWNWVGIALVALVSGLIYRKRKKNHG